MLCLRCDYIPGRVALFFFTDLPTTETYTLSLHDALPILIRRGGSRRNFTSLALLRLDPATGDALLANAGHRSEEHTSELQSLRHLVCRLLLEKKKNGNSHAYFHISLDR